jgi:hypothetical protein
LNFIQQFITTYIIDTDNRILQYNHVISNEIQLTININIYLYVFEMKKSNFIQK